MSAGKYKATSGGKKRELTEEERVERYTSRLSRDMNRACDDYQLRTNGYKSNGFRGIINASVLKAQSENGTL